MSRPTVSVLVTTFAHERFVAEALDAVLSQQVEFAFEVIVGVDASEDGTGDVVRRFERESPGIVRAVHHPSRVGLFENFRAVFSAASGPYVALLEGDDYWTDTGKLRKQVALLERHPEAVLCGHLVEHRTLEGDRIGTIPEPAYAGPVSRREFVERLCDFHTSSLVFRNVFPGGLPPNVLDEQSRVFDLALKLALAARGEVLFVPEAMSVFRRVPGSASSAIDDEGWRDIIVRSLRGARGQLPPFLREVVDRQLVELLVGGALSPGRRRIDRAALAVGALRRRPLAAARGLARGVYSGLPESAKRLYRDTRERWSPRTGGDRA